jgi:RNA polymerase sigma-70 factor (ECF subfamily)
VEVTVTTDADLVARVAAGDRLALEELYRRHAPWLAARLSRLTSTRDLAEEALQDTFLSAWRGARGYSGEGEVSAWLWGIARRRLASAARSRRALPLQSWEPAAEDPLQSVLAAEEASRVRRAVDRLPADQRAAIHSVVYQDLSIGQAAAVLGVSGGTVKSRLFRARARIRKELEL